MANVYRDEGDDHIRLYAAEDYGDDSERLTVAEAREVAQQLIQQADAIDAEIAAARVRTQVAAELREITEATITNWALLYPIPANSLADGAAADRLAANWARSATRMIFEAIDVARRYSGMTPKETQQ